MKRHIVHGNSAPTLNGMGNEWQFTGSTGKGLMWGYGNCIEGKIVR